MDFLARAERTELTEMIGTSLSLGAAFSKMEGLAVAGMLVSTVTSLTGSLSTAVYMSDFLFVICSHCTSDYLY